MKKKTAIQQFCMKDSCVPAQQKPKKKTTIRALLLKTKNLPIPYSTHVFLVYYKLFWISTRARINGK